MNTVWFARTLNSRNEAVPVLFASDPGKNEFAQKPKYAQDPFPVEVEGDIDTPGILKELDQRFPIPVIVKHNVDTLKKLADGDIAPPSPSTPSQEERLAIKLEQAATIIHKMALGNDLSQQEWLRVDAYLRDHTHFVDAFLVTFIEPSLGE